MWRNLVASVAIGEFGQIDMELWSEVELVVVSVGSCACRSELTRPNVNFLGTSHAQ